jgi:Tol biopolymer transport system component
MPLSPGTRIGAYEIVDTIGAGGMGEVYRGRDARLGREVAIKVLPAAFARDPDRLVRFEREARTLAALSHSNVAQVYGFEEFAGEAGTTFALVMELLEGETLRERLTSAGVAGLPVRKVVEYASQIARGLAAAHERGLVHRDLKPENVFVLRDGQVKLLDFGLARAAGPEPSGATETMTRLSPATDPGTVMGTVGYMAPEQVRGAVVDARADLFALGCVLYEMLTGQRAFRRETPAETMTAILNEDPPDMGNERTDLSPALDRIVGHCLEKNPNERFQTARDVAFALNALSGSASAPVVAVPARARSRAALAWAIVSAVLAGALVWQLVVQQRDQPAPPAGVAYRVSVPLPEGFSNPADRGPSLRLAASPDGRRAVIEGATPGERTRLWLVSLVNGTVAPIAGTEGAFGPAWAPDGERLLYSVAQELRVMNADGGPSAAIGESGGASWSVGDVVLFGRPGTPIWRTLASGGPKSVVIDRQGRESLGLSWFLDDGRRFIYRKSDPDNPDTDGIYLASIDGQAPERILVDSQPGNINVAYDSGALLYVRDTSLVAQPLDLQTRAAGPAVTIAEDVDTRGALGSAYSVSRTGTLVYLPSTVRGLSRLVWMNRRGETLSAVGDVADYSNVELSPDGRRILVSVTSEATRTRDIYVVDVERGVRQRLTFDASDERSAVWSPDGRTIVYNSKGLDLYQRRSDFTAEESPVFVDGRSKDPRQISPDGRFLLYRHSGQGTGSDLWLVPLEGDRTPRLVAGTPFNENYGVFSPDGSAMAYLSDETGQVEVYVMQIDVAGGGKTLVSTAGGTFPRWRRDGREILYAALDGTIMSVPVSGAGVTFQAGVPRPLFHAAFQPGPGTPFDVSADGERFLVNTAIPSKTPQVLRMIVNWPALVPRAKP